ncbi:GNAT family N-acetyltransferase [Actinoplanes sp. TFC3]|uniref:GNAT family N-acetyltransferase n=1 Tax=Actinoplanes sp. TFC3 TaxID=1710355 RepID=UPI000832370B|nr:GNAT family N-acetyltransferase [Actinoplanes sp. TFC3]
MLIESRPATDPELAALLMAQQQEISDTGTGGYGVRCAPRADVAYLVVVLQHRVVACGGWRVLEDDVAEIKRMYVRPSFRGRGIARQLIVALEEEALAAGRPMLRLETGTDLSAAIGLYRSAGYREIPAYGEHAGNPFSVCFEKSLLLTSH